MKVEVNNTKTMRLWAEDLPTLLRDVATFLEDHKREVRAAWTVEISSCSPSVSIYENKWMCIITMFDTTGTILETLERVSLS